MASDSSDLFRWLRVKIQNLIQRGVVTAVGATRYQGTHLGGASTDDLENFQPQGLHFQVPIGAEYVQLHPVAEMANALAVGMHVRSGLPDAPRAEAAVVAPGEGGLHYLGDYKVFLDADGKVYLGGKPDLTVTPIPEVSDFLVQVDKFNSLIARMLQEGAAIGGPGAANFVGASTFWGTPGSVDNTTAGTTKTKAT